MTDTIDLCNFINTDISVSDIMEVLDDEDIINEVEYRIDKDFADYLVRELSFKSLNILEKAIEDYKNKKTKML